MEENWQNDEYVRYYNSAYTTSPTEFAEYIEVLDLKSDDFVLDLGCGDGTFLDVVAPHVAGVRGVDVSSLQVKLANERLQNRANAKAIQSDFVNCATVLQQDNPAIRFTKGFSRKALHHLTDDEKYAMLQALSPLFAPGSVLYFEDGIFFNFEREQIQEKLPELMEDCARYYGDSWESKRNDLLHSFLDEHPTGSGFWTRALDEAGFTVTELKPRSSFYGGLLAVKR